jgi:hypothetical protein
VENNRKTKFALELDFILKLKQNIKRNYVVVEVIYLSEVRRK